MGECNMEDLPLPALFEQAQKIHMTVTESGADQELVRKGCEALEKCEDMINKLGLFSANETKDDISTTNLKYSLVIVGLQLLFPMRLINGDLIKSSKQLFPEFYFSSK